MPTARSSESSVKIRRSARSERSITAEATVWLRAVGAREPDEAIRNPDSLAQDLVDPRVRALGRVPGGWPLALRAWEAFAPGYYKYELARTKFIDNVLLGELSEGIDQLVLVGSGYDSRVHRFAEQLAGVCTFEVDKQATLAQKRRREQKRGYADGRAKQVALDLNLATPLEALRQHGYDDDARTLFVCSGVLMYLDPDAVDRLLAFVTAGGAGSSICFDFFYASALADPASYYGAERMIRNATRAREPYRFTIDPQELPALVDRQGMRLVTEVGPEELERTYAPRARGLSGRRPICGYAGLAHAKTQPSPGPLG